MTHFTATDTTGHKQLIIAETLREAETIAEERVGESLYSVVSVKIINNLTKGGMTRNDTNAIAKLLATVSQQENI